ncbi:hypothetical protein C8J56DRAFT_1162010 [Mycena floridula]|nr:hypothetical protein C8J56DRAFT_1162010 [Mycena floridula]
MKSTSEAADTKARLTPVRATKEEIALLEKAYNENPGAQTREKEQELSGQTSLTVAWIHAWFLRRKRKSAEANGTTKTRKAKPEPVDSVLPPPSRKKKAGQLLPTPPSSASKEQDPVKPSSSTSASAIPLFSAPIPVRATNDFRFENLCDSDELQYPPSPVKPVSQAKLRAELQTAPQRVVGSSSDQQNISSQNISNPSPLFSQIQSQPIIASSTRLPLLPTMAYQSTHVNQQGLPFSSSAAFYQPIPRSTDAFTYDQNNAQFSSTSQSQTNGFSSQGYYRHQYPVSHTPQLENSQSSTPYYRDSHSGLSYSMPQQLNDESSFTLDPKTLPLDLDSNSAPLKHLPLLQPFLTPQEDGSYRRLDKAALLNLTLHHQLNPFEVSMGLCLLQRLGFKW